MSAVTDVTTDSTTAAKKALDVAFWIQLLQMWSTSSERNFAVGGETATK